MTEELDNFWTQNQNRYDSLANEAYELEIKLGIEDLGVNEERPPATNEEERSLYKRLDKISTEIAEIEEREKDLRQQLETKNQEELFFHFIREYGIEPFVSKYSGERHVELVRGWRALIADPETPENDRDKAKKKLLKIGRALAGVRKEGAPRLLSYDTLVQLADEYEAVHEEAKKSYPGPRIGEPAPAELAEETLANKYNISIRKFKEARAESRRIRDYM